MKKQKLVCMIIAILLLCSAMVLPASAQAQQPDEAALLQAFKAYLDENKVAYQEWEELVFVEPITQSNGWTIFYGTSGISNERGGVGDEYSSCLWIDHISIAGHHASGRRP